MPHIVPHRDYHPYQPHDSRNDSVPNFPFGRLVTETITFGPVGVELETQAAVDNAERDEHAAVPDMGCGPERAAVRALEDIVVGDAEERLKREEADDNKADDRVGVVDLYMRVSQPSYRAHGREKTNSSFRFQGDVDTQAKAYNR